MNENKIARSVNASLSLLFCASAPLRLCVKFRRLVAAALLPLLGGLGCARPLYVTAERVASAPDGRAWVAGSEGFSAFSSGGALIRRDYPKNPSAEAYEYEHYMVPAAQLVIFSGQTYLFTRPGEVFVDRGGWRKLPVRLPRSGSDHVQVDDVIAAPGERLFIRLHPGVLLFTTREGLERSAFEAEQAPEHNYFTWLGFFGDTLYALGFEGGERRALQRREGPGRWATVSVLPSESLLGSLHGVVQLRGQQWMTAEDDRPERLAVVVGNGLVMIGPRGEPKLMRTEALLPAKVARAAAMSRSPRRGDLLAAPADLKVAAPPDAPTAFQSPSYVMGLFTVPGSGPVLVIEGAHTGVLELGEQGSVFSPCSLMLSAVGAIPIPGGLRFVTQDAAVVDVSAGGCRQIQGPLIRAEERRGEGL